MKIRNDDKKSAHHRSNVPSSQPVPATPQQDNLGVTRGQNGEKGDTVRPENIVRRRRAEH